MSLPAKFIFLHGWATDAWVWDEIAKTLGKEYLNPCLPGHGSRFTWDAPTLAPAMRAINESLRASGAPSIAVGWSLGGQALLAHACENPKAFKALVLVGSTPCFTAVKDFPHGQSRAMVKRMTMDMKKNPVETLKRFYCLNFTDEELALPGSKAFLEKYAGTGTGASNRPVFNYNGITLGLEALYKNDLRLSLSRLNLPCLIVHGTSDNVCPVEAGKYLGAHINGAQFVEFEGAGHAPFITQPRRFAEIIKDFAREL